MQDAEAIKTQIREAFASVQYPGDWCLAGSNEGDEPFRVEQDFRGKGDWRTIDPVFLDESPDGLGSSLTFFSDEAFRFYLPAYLIAAIDDRLERQDPTFHLRHGLAETSRNEPINPRRYGRRTWSEHAKCKFAMFSVIEARAIVGYLLLKAERAETDFERALIEQALNYYWLERAADREPGCGIQ